MKISATSRYTLRQIALVLSTAGAFLTPVYAAVIAPIKADIDMLKNERIELKETVAKMAGQLDAIVLFFGIKPKDLRRE